MRLAVLSLGCLAAMAAMPVHAQDDAQALRREIDAMRQMLQGMQQRLDQLERREEHAAAAPVALPSPMPAAPQTTTTVSTASGILHPTQVPGVAPPVLPQRESVADPSTAASRPDSAAGPTDPDLKGFFAIPGTDTVIRIGGYAKLDAIADSRGAGDEDQFIPSSMPVGGNHRDVSNFNIHA